MQEAAKSYVKSVTARRRCPSTAVQVARTFLALLAQLSLRPDVPVKRHGFDPELSAEFGHGGAAVGHRGLGQPHLGFRQRELPAALSPARPRGLEPSHGAFTDQFPFELGQRREDAEHEAAGRGGGVDLRALTGESSATTFRVSLHATRKVLGSR